MHDLCKGIPCEKVSYMVSCLRPWLHAKHQHPHCCTTVLLAEICRPVQITAGPPSAHHALRVH